MGLKKLCAGEKQSLEFSKYSVIIDSRRFHVIIVYRPPYSEQHPVTVNTFLSEFSNFLETLVLCSEPILICGDFNIHVDVQNDVDAIKFLELLESMGLENHVFFQTHESGHALDLVITSSTDGVKIENPLANCYISDHSFVRCFLAAPKPDLAVKQISYCKYKSIDFDQFKADLSASPLCTEDFTDVSLLAKCYEDTLSDLIDKHAPLVNKTRIIRPVQPWRCDSIRDLKLEKRHLEAKWRSSKSDSDRDKLKKARNVLANTIEQKRVEYYSDMVEQCEGDQRKLFNVKEISGVYTENPLPEHDNAHQLANCFGEFFVTKVKTIQEVTEEVTCHSTFNKFEALSEDEVRKLVRLSASKQGMSDPAPTWVVKHCIDTTTVGYFSRFLENCCSNTPA